MNYYHTDVTLCMHGKLAALFGILRLHRGSLVSVVTVVHST